MATGRGSAQGRAQLIARRMQSAHLRARVDAVTAEVVRELRADGVRPLLLRGPALAGWLYGEHSSRVYCDSDLLVSPPQFAAAQRCLARLGFRQTLDDSDLPGTGLPGHPWMRGGDSVDLHWTIPGVGAAPDALWNALSPSTDVIYVAGVEVEVPAVAGRALIVALHVAHHGLAMAKPREDLRRACELLGDPTWATAAALANDLQANDTFSAGLATDPCGRGIAQRLGLDERLPVDVALRAGDPPPGAVTLELLARAPGPHAKLSLAARKVVPTRRFMRHWFPRSTRGPRWMLAGYLWRSIWLLLKTRRAVLAWRRERKLRNASAGTR